MSYNKWPPIPRTKQKHHEEQNLEGVEKLILCMVVGKGVLIRRLKVIDVGPKVNNSVSNNSGSILW